MAEFNYMTRKKITEAWILWLKKNVTGLGTVEKQILQGIEGELSEVKWMIKTEERLREQPELTLSEVIKKDLLNLVKVCVPEGKETEFYYAIDQMNQYQMTAGWYRRSVRGKGYAPFLHKAIQLLYSYSKIKYFNVALTDILLGKVEAEIYDYTRNYHWNHAEIIAAQLDNDNGTMFEAVKEILFAENNTAIVTHELIRGMVMSKKKEVHKLLGDFLLAARLQEGVRQAVCETMDVGRSEAFLHLFQVIEENNLIRFSAVKRAVSTWIGIFDENSMERITDKLLKLMGQCLRDSKFCEEQLNSNDSIAISCALWAKGFYDADEAVLAVKELVEKGTKNQKMTASYFNRSLQRSDFMIEAAKDVILNHREDLELVACFMPSFLPYMEGQLSACVSGRYYSSKDSEAKEPAKMPIMAWFQSVEEIEVLYEALKQIYKDMPKKGIDLNPCIFPWYRVTMTRSQIAVRLCAMAWMIQKEAYFDDAAEYISTIGQGEAYVGSGRASAVRVLLYKPNSQKRKDILIELMHNPEEYTYHAACKMAEIVDWTPEDYRKIEKNLKYKKGREGAITLLKKQEPKALSESLKRLLKEKSEDCHMGALDIALEMKKEGVFGEKELQEILAVLEEPTGKEGVLLKEILGETSEAQDILTKPGYGFYDTSKEFVLPPVKVDEKLATKLFRYGDNACMEVLKKLSLLIEKNQMLEYKDCWGEERVLGASLVRSRILCTKDRNLHPMDEFPFRELWDAFYEKEIQTPALLLEVYLYQRCCQRSDAYAKNEDIYKKIFAGGWIIKKPPFQTLTQNFPFYEQIKVIIQNLFLEKVPDTLKAYWGFSVTARLVSVLDDSNITYEIMERHWNTTEKVEKMTANLPIIGECISWLSCVKDEEWGSAFTLRFQLKKRHEKLRDKAKQHTWNSWNYRYEEEQFTGLKDYVQCYVRGIWDKDIFYKAVFEFSDITTLFAPISIVEQKGQVSSRNARVYDLNRFFGMGKIEPVEGKYCFEGMDSTMPEMSFAHQLYEEIVPQILKVELKRGEQETPFSLGIQKLQVVYGIDTLIQILTALGKDTLKRGGSYYSLSASDRRSVLSHLLQICQPKPEETVENLKQALKGTDITKKRLIEMAMYAKQWIPMVEEYLELEGFKDGCYYFMAHTSEQFDEYTTSMIAKYTPLSPEALHDGAFDINWFFEAYEKLGEKEFQMLYDAAKYSATGAAHSRARKYADAALGKVEVSELKEQIDEKRNKDLLMSIGLVPFSTEKAQKEAEMLERYQFIQKFKKESRQFGAQRRASEGRAVELAMENLSVTAGFSDVTRLTLYMETKLSKTMEDYYEWKALDEEVEIHIFVDESGKSSLECKKNGKALKSIPAKYKKNEMVQEYQEVNKKLKEQYVRTKQMLEQAMEDRTIFEVWELLSLQDNLVVRPIVEPLVVKTAKDKPVGETMEEDLTCLGFLTKSGLMNWEGVITEISPETKVYIAHPFDLYKEGHWHEYQKVLFERQMKQPFKQVFRELYVKLSEEMEKEYSFMFAGNQIQPKKTVGALRNRRWVADYEDGLQKVYYKENIVARIYAMADWFSPSDIEAPTLEYVVFQDRKSFKRIPIKEVPDIIYSEVMRDVDLAVGVAHAGGVDPETSHSTIEMHRAIVECNLALFKITNVEVKDSHAFVTGKRGSYTIHLGSGVVHQIGGSMLYVIPVHSAHRGRIFLPFVDEDPKTAEIMSKILLFAEDNKIKDPKILEQIK